MSLRVPTLFCLAFAVPACIFGGGGDDPENGTWEVGEATVDVNDCDIDLAKTGVEVPTGFYFFKEFDGSYTLALLEDPDTEIECQILGDLSCDRETFTVPLGPTSLDIRNELTATVDGNKDMTMMLTTRVECAGGLGCDVAKGTLEIEEFPCEIIQSFDADWTSDELGPLDPLAGLE